MDKRKILNGIKICQHMLTNWKQHNSITYGGTSQYGVEELLEFLEDLLEAKKYCECEEEEKKKKKKDD